MNNYFQMTIGNFGNSEPGEGNKFDSIKIEIFLKSSRNIENYIPTTYKRVNIDCPGLNNCDYAEAIALSYEIDYDKNCYIVEIPFDFYLRQDLYRQNDNIYVGLIQK